MDAPKSGGRGVEKQAGRGGGVAIRGVAGIRAGPPMSMSRSSRRSKQGDIERAGGRMDKFGV